jgi:hypothetical protein
MRWPGLRAWWLLPAVALVIVSASCGVRPTVTVPAPPSGSAALISGTVEASPTCPVERPGHACRPRALGDVLVEARSARGGVVARTRTRADGRYSLLLGRGRYVLMAVTGQVFPRCPDVPVFVASPAPVHVNINCDSGIR